MTTPLVSIPVITYNSAKTVVETLDSIKAQTYPRLELIVSDDCSTDDTVALCQEWIKQNKERFERTKVILAEQNTGVSANFNRGETACRGEWVKPIAGDDLLMPACVRDCMDYVMTHPETIYLFGRQKAFGADEDRCKQIDNVFDYTFFSKTIDEQLHHLIFDCNCVPATTVFYGRLKAKDIGVTNDERIPLLEDWPKWVNLLRAGVKFQFVDKELVKYRVGGVSTNSQPSLNYYRTARLFCFLYQYPEWYKENPDAAVKRVVKEEAGIYEYLIDAERQLNLIRASKAYRLGRALLTPFRIFRHNK